MSSLRCTAGLLVLAAGASGCYPFTVMGRAQTVDPGQVELLAAAGAGGVAVVNATQNVEPRFELGVRYGLSSSTDIGLRLDDSGGLATFRLQLLRTPLGSFRFDILGAPGIAYTYPQKLSFELPVLFGFDLPSGDELVVAPRVVEMFDFGEPGLGHPVPTAFVGASIEYVWQVWARVALVPELAILKDVYTEPGFAAYTSAGPAFQFAFGVLWDPR